MKKLGNILKIMGIVLFFAAPFYQFVNEYIDNVDGDGKRVYGNNPVFKNLLGVKTDRYYFLDAQGWEYENSVIETTTWMQKIGFAKVVGFSDIIITNCSPSVFQAYSLVILRWIIRLLIPGIFFIPGIIILNKQKPKIKKLIY